MLDKTNLQFHHIGIPTDEEKPNERWEGPTWDMYTSEVKSSRINAQWHRFGKNCPLPKLITTVPHVGFKVDNIDDAIIGEDVLYGPKEAMPGYFIAFIDDNGVPVELVQTNLSDEEALAIAKKGGVNKTSSK